MNRKTAYKLSELIAAANSPDDLKPVIEFLKPQIEKSREDGKVSWVRFGEKFLSWIESIYEGRISPVPFTIFKEDGNKKLPFVAFSTLPGVTCPGAGECLGDPKEENGGKIGWCYSFRAWRYPAAFYRQCQNTLLVKMKHFDLVDEWTDTIKKGATVRLYVDGDIDSLETLEFWFDMCLERPDLKVYGYSKSWEIFLSYADSGKAFPENYVLNLSGGSKYNEAYKRRMEGLPCSRGEFIAVTIDKKNDAPIGARTNAYRKAVREAAGERVFVCPGLCGSCTSAGAACGSEAFKGVKIAIGTH